MITVNSLQNNLKLTIEAQLFNNSSAEIDLSALKKSIIQQLQRVYQTQIGKYVIDFSITIEIISTKWQCSPKKILIQVVDSVLNNNPAEADFKGMRIKLNKNCIDDIIANKNTRTIPHEIGHLLGWDHPHARSSYQSINLEASELEQSLTEEERQVNLMSQTWYAQKAGVDLEQAMQLTEKQIELLLEYSAKKELNKNFHLNYFLFWKKIV